jgi:hypothetical protein
MPSTKDRGAQLAAVAELREYDHIFISAEGVRQFAAAFGVNLKPRTAKADASPDNPKGLVLSDGASEAEGLDATELAELVCVHFGIGYGSSLHGRGARLRVACDLLEKYLTS